MGSICVRIRRESCTRGARGRGAGDALGVLKGVGIFLVDILGLEARHAIRERHARSHAVGGATEAIHVLACIGRYSVTVCGNMWKRWESFVDINDIEP